MSNPGPSTSSAAAGGAGAPGDGDKDNQPSSSRAKKPTTTPRQSVAVQMQMKVLRAALERLMNERGDITDIKNLLRKSLYELDDEIATIRKTLDLARRAYEFQHSDIFNPNTTLPLPAEGAACSTPPSPPEFKAETMDSLFDDPPPAAEGPNGFIDEASDGAMSPAPKAGKFETWTGWPYDGIIKTEPIDEEDTNSLQALSDYLSPPEDNND